MSRLTRRRFLKTTAATSAAFSLFTISGTQASGQVIGANGSVRVAVAGINGRGKSHIDEFAKQENVQVNCLVDPDSRLFKSNSKKLSDKYNTDPKCVQDIREALDDKSIDVVSIATCNHWHSLLTIWACQAGKHVYVEKPISHNVFEGRKCVEASQKYGRIVQHGTQQRSDARIERSRSQPFNRESMANCSSPKATAVSRVGRLESNRKVHRPKASTSTSGSARRQSNRSMPTCIPTTGIGSGTLATAIPATRASTKSTWHGGASKTPPCPIGSGAWAVDTYPKAKTRVRHPTCNCRSMSLATCCWSLRRAGWLPRKVRRRLRWPMSFIRPRA